MGINIIVDSSICQEEVFCLSQQTIRALQQRYFKLCYVERFHLMSQVAEVAGLSLVLGYFKG